MYKGERPQEYPPQPPTAAWAGHPAHVHRRKSMLVQQAYSQRSLARRVPLPSSPRAPPPAPASCVPVPSACSAHCRSSPCRGGPFVRDPGGAAPATPPARTAPFPSHRVRPSALMQRAAVASGVITAEQRLARGRYGREGIRQSALPSFGTPSLKIVLRETVCVFAPSRAHCPGQAAEGREGVGLR
eukprot:scaffold1108_cov387-Prasinococcus_capsulatus_cf.AAC.6